MTSVGTVIGPHLDVVKDLPADVLAGIERIAVCCRDGVQTSVVATEDAEIFKRIMPNYPSDIEHYLTKSSREARELGLRLKIAVDIQSIGTNNQRIYILPGPDTTLNNAPFLDLLGRHYNSSNELLSYKKYFKHGGYLKISRYGADDTLTSDTDTERYGQPESTWNGSQELKSTLVPLAESNDFRVTFLTKDYADQTYMYFAKRVV